MRKALAAFNLLVAMILAGCATAPAPREWTAWQARRNESIGGTNGWTTIIARHWLTNGENRVHEQFGLFTRSGTNVAFKATPGVNVQVNGVAITQTNLIDDADLIPTKLQIGSTSIVAIVRGERVGLRVRDANSERRRSFHGIHWFPYNPRWRIEGRFEPFDTPKKMRVPDVTGSIQEMISPGAIIFKAHGRTQRLEVVDEPGEEDYFVMFRDDTTGKETYPTGRFLYVPKPAADQRVTIDFNRAYTPPCAYTDFATCPLPPPQNRLRLPIPAGETNPLQSPQ